MIDRLGAKADVRAIRRARLRAAINVALFIAWCIVAYSTVPTLADRVAYLGAAFTIEKGNRHEQ